MGWTYIADVLVDAAITENPSFTNMITEHPIEDGSVICDHVGNEPTILSFEITVTGQEGMPADDKRERLHQLTQDKEVIDVTGALFNYSMMVIEEFAPHKDSEIKNGFTADITLKQIRVVELETVDLVLGPDPVTGNQPQAGDDDMEVRGLGEENTDEDTLSSFGYEMLIAPFVEDDD